MNIKRFDGANFWIQLTPEQQTIIGGLAVELAIAGLTLERVLLAAPGTIANADVLERAASAAGSALMNALKDAVANESDQVELDGLPIPVFLGPICIRCGCSEEDACEGGCGWADGSKTVCTECMAVEAMS